MARASPHHHAALSRSARDGAHAADTGSSIALSSDGTTLAVGAEDADTTPAGQDAGITNAAGTACVFARAGTSWTEQAYLRASNTRPSEFFGRSLTLSGNGSALVVGAYGETSAATGFNGNQADTSAPVSGAAYAFARTGTQWKQTAYVKASNPRTSAEFGISVALSGDGAMLAVGSDGESSASKSINGDQTDTTASSSGAVYVFR